MGLGGKNGPSFEGLQAQFREKLQHHKGQEVSQEEVFESIIASVSPLNPKLSRHYVSFPIGGQGADADQDSPIFRLAANYVHWQKTSDASVPYEATISNVPCRIRLNDFPDEPLYSLFQENQHVADFDDWPASWDR